jgi:hypothetical protein
VSLFFVCFFAKKGVGGAIGGGSINNKQVQKYNITVWVLGIYCDLS